MALVFESGKNIQDIVTKTPLFMLYDSHIVINHKDEKKVFDLDEITNVRFQKKRNFSINIFLFFFTIFIYSFLTDYFELNFAWSFLLFIITVALIFVFFSIENYTYILFINMTHFGFRKLILSRKDELYAEHFVSLFKKIILIKKYN